MNMQEIQMPPHHRAVVNRFVLACQADERVVAALLYGSYARGAADTYSDLDLALITTEAAYAAFLVDKAQFVRQLGEPLFLEDFDLPRHIFFIFSDDSEGELGVGHENDFNHLFRGSYQLLLDKKGLLGDAVFVGDDPDPAEQIEKLRRQITWFWHELSHFINALARRQLWWAYGQLDELRLHCVNLAHLHNHFAVGWEGYFKVEQNLSVAQLAALEATICPLDADAMLRAAHAILRFYQEVAPPLAQAHSVPYPADLERLLVARLAKLGDLY